MFFDWNGNGEDDDLFDDMLDLALLDEMENDNKISSSNNGSRNSGSCLAMLITMPIWIPLTLILTFLGVIKV